MRPTTPAAALPGKDIIVVNSDDEEVGHDFKASVHRGDGVRHRAFSVYLFDSESRLLLQQRSEHKPLWPGYWSNSCCSHPRPGETTGEAASRRVREELGLSRVSALRFLFKFEYLARYEQHGVEHEVCSVYAGVADQPLAIDRSEIANVRYVSASHLDEQLHQDGAHYTPWLQIAWRSIRADHWGVIASMVREPA